MITWSDTVHATQNENVQCMHHYWNPKMISLTDLNINLLRARVHHNQCSNGPRPVNRLGRLNGQLLACLLQWSFHLNNRTVFKLSLACFHFEGNRCCKTSLWVLYFNLWPQESALFVKLSICLKPLYKLYILSTLTNRIKRYLLLVMLPPITLFTDSGRLGEEKKTLFRIYVYHNLRLMIYKIKMRGLHFGAIKFRFW